MTIALEFKVIIENGVSYLQSQCFNCNTVERDILDDIPKGESISNIAYAIENPMRNFAMVHESCSKRKN